MFEWCKCDKERWKPYLTVATRESDFKSNTWNKIQWVTCTDCDSLIQSFAHPVSWGAEPGKRDQRRQKIKRIFVFNSYISTNTHTHILPEGKPYFICSDEHFSWWLPSAAWYTLFRSIYFVIRCHQQRMHTWYNFFSYRLDGTHNHSPYTIYSQLMMYVHIAT